ncbi:BP74-related protein [Microbacterium sp. RD1]|uniref:BP74-related protein n=1 Tax=Microbacterium sp. RD1 TaxID=3457313 RepID=UPI003FA5ABA1
MKRIAPLTLVAAVALLAGCAGPGGGADSVPSVATFEVVDQTYRIELVTPELVEHARQLLDGEEVAAIPVGRIVRGDASVNEPWSWHIDPDTVEFADFTTEVCDGLPEFVEDRTLTSDTYCPWSAKIVSLEPAP